MYSKQISSTSPGLFVILVDQSDSMGDPYEARDKESTYKDEFAALAVNRTISEILESCQDGDKMKDRCHIAVIGYGKTTQLLIEGLPTEIEDPTYGTRTVKGKQPDGAGGFSEVEEEIGIWVKPVHNNGTPMATAFGAAADLIEAWTAENPANFPPIVFNITDGEPDDINQGASATRSAAQRVADCHTTDGKVLIYNCHIGIGTPEVILPSSEQSLATPSAKLLFQMSSVIPQELFRLAENAGLAPQTGSRGFCMNATPETLTKLLDFGSAKAR